MIGKRLKSAREAMGLSLRDLAARIGNRVTAQAIGKYERSESMPSSGVLLALSKGLDVTPEYLLRERDTVLSGVDFRKGPQAGIKEEKTVEAIVVDRVERYLELEALMPDAERSWCFLSREEFRIRQVSDAEAAAELLRDLWLLGRDPIPMMAELLEDKGIKIIAVDLPENVSGSKAFVEREDADKVAVIVVNSRHNGERQRFTLAHELAHLVLEFVEMNDRDQEKAADHFAGAFLMAKEMLISLLGKHRSAISIGELVELKKLFRVSLAALVVRCRQVGVITAAVYGRIWSQIRSMGWNGPNSNEPALLPSEVPQRMERISLRAVAEGFVSEAKAAELLKISVRELDRRLTPIAA